MSCIVTFNVIIPCTSKHSVHRHYIILAAAGSAGANDNEEAAPGREGDSECRGERHDAAETAGKEAVKQVNV